MCAANLFEVAHFDTDFHPSFGSFVVLLKSKYLSKGVFERLAFQKPAKDKAERHHRSMIVFDKEHMSPKIVPRDRSFIPGSFNRGNYNNGAALVGPHAVSSSVGGSASGSRCASRCGRPWRNRSCSG